MGRLINESLLIMTILLLSQALSFGEGNTDTTAQLSEVPQQYYDQQVKILVDQKNIEGIGVIADQARQQYFLTTLNICNILVSNNLGNSNLQLELAHEYSMSALRQADAMPLVTEIGLVKCLADNIEYTTKKVKGDDWEQLRKSRYTVWLHAWSRLINSVDMRIDINQRLPMNPPLPPGVNLPEGVTPEAIKDPKLRAQYEESIQKHHEQANSLLEQRQTRKLLESFSPLAERYLIEVYSLPPYNIDELQQLLDHSEIAIDVRERIVGGVAKKMGLVN